MVLLWFYVKTSLNSKYYFYPIIVVILAFTFHKLDVVFNVGLLPTKTG